MAFPNRIAAAIEKLSKALEDVPTAKLAKMDKIFQEDCASLCTYQKAQSHGFAAGKLTQEEAVILYHLYGGECPSAQAWAKQPLAARIVATQAVSELLRTQIAAHRR